MDVFKIALVASVAAFLMGSASAASDSAIGGQVADSHFAVKCGVDLGHSTPDAPAGYSPLGIAKINGIPVAVYGFQNGAKIDDVAGEGHGFADVFDSAGHLIRRFTFRENLNSPPQITEYVPIRARELTDSKCAQ